MTLSNTIALLIPVQLVRTNGPVEIGKLLYKTGPRVSVKKTSPAKSHWMVSVQGSSDSEDISETKLGRVLDTATETANSSDSSLSGSTAGSVANNNGSPSTKARSKTKRVHKKSSPKAPDSAEQRRLHHTRACTRSNGDNSELLGGIEQVDLPPLRKKRKVVKANDRNVTVVKMLTGTLYLYKGKHRRAEFIRSK